MNTFPSPDPSDSVRLKRLEGGRKYKNENDIGE
jgi:hypothetical protein